MNTKTIGTMSRALYRRTYSTQTAALAAAKRRIAETDSANPFFVDTFGRKHDYLRISLTERCNLRCFYCMPEEGIELSPEGKILTNEEVVRLARLFVKNGVNKIRLTGGEPTVRKGIIDLLKELNELKSFGLKSIAMTSNGLALHRRLPQMIENGLSHLNLSLDTLDPFKFELITRRRGHEAVLKAIDVALGSSLSSVKLNVVVVKGLNDAEVVDFVKLTKDHPLSVRFIEFMPFTGNKWDQAKMVPSADLLSRIQAEYPSATRDLEEPNETARTWKIPGFRGSFGFISSMSDHFCSSCNRLRLTADGQIKVCLFDPSEISLRDIMRQGASDDQILQTIQKALSGKKEKHAGMNDIDVKTNRPMILIDRPYKSRKPLRPSRLPYWSHPANLESMHARWYSTKLTHIDGSGRANMVDVGEKEPTKRSATASGRIYITPLAYELVTKSYPAEEAQDAESLSSEQRAANKSRRKGDTLTIAQLAAIMGAKQTANLIPLCHPLSLSNIRVELKPCRKSERPSGNGDEIIRHFIQCNATVSCEGKTGVEMEALTAVSVGLLTVWDMLKAVAGREMEITDVKVVTKSGGMSGDFVRKGA
ncbi:molybdenum cofactor synthesis-step 1 protein isoform 2 [Ephemerocybe angulata]|uniref:Molybdenum cofactor synthesis-step 1 protein isoform 2 n=1 Tax=Ephemerocybe angulata TaxID=980116 RepID=A0A8H6MH37_9AGAR|nr:molybdenum cofactor synthesis-step 1 protein isoform 2 [Tulosesus angulatus]